jgi:hypothetical protein
MPDDRTLAGMVRGPAKAGPYRTLLSLLEELEFGGWLKANRIPYEDIPTADYDMRGFWKALKSGDPRARQAYDPMDRTMHFPDTWKTPYHETFSNESLYALPTAPHWEGTKLVNPLGIVLTDESKPRRR